MRQPQKTLAYIKALQFWAEKAKLPQASQPCQLVACVKELRESMEQLTSFSNEEVLTDDPPLPWVKITPSQCSKAVGPEAMQE